MIAYFPDPWSWLQEPSQPEMTSVILPGGAVAELRCCGINRYQVQNLICTDPQAYISSRFRPGQIIDGSTLQGLLTHG